MQLESALVSWFRAMRRDRRVCRTDVRECSDRTAGRSVVQQTGHLPPPTRGYRESLHRSLDYNPRVLPRILVADDDRMTVLIIAAALRGEFDVVIVSTGAEVLERAAAGDFDLILLDVMMPDLDGFEVCRRLANHPHTAKIPVIFVTALEETADEAHGFAVGGVDYITKPIRPAVVRARVRTHVELKRSRDALERLAAVDPLTGIANRRAFDSAIQSGMAPQPAAQPMAVAGDGRCRSLQAVQRSPW